MHSAASSCAIAVYALLVFVLSDPLGAADDTTAASATTSSTATSTTHALLDTILPANLTVEARADLAAVHASTTWDDYQPARLLATAHRLHLAGRERALSVLKIYVGLNANAVYEGHTNEWNQHYTAGLIATDFDCNRVVLLCRLLFVGDTPDIAQGMAWASNLVPVPAFVGLWPTGPHQRSRTVPPRMLVNYPMLIIQGFPFLLINSMILPLSSSPISPDGCASAALDYAEHHCHWKVAEDNPLGDPLAAAAAVEADQELLAVYELDDVSHILGLIRTQTYRAYAPTLSAAERIQLAGNDWDPRHPDAAARWQAFQVIAHAKPVAWDPTSSTFIPALAK